ncbi:hypothetical protein N780_07985 [Pontibacillus chungwhensis BH030062]|uniref:Uncharacterized protein n=1 Tax=Pontibacillus chungwhensis BH030062 TaxID=1385513 RepID=A0A0A2UX29_9BACI|nr:hypothetical protein [Pontibacillus chungwhensis]KGP91293.1 hypothetical protein N780_07985 [Pontibacillus chungwhensis BH030062]
MWVILYGVIIAISWIQIRGLWSQSNKRDSLIYIVTMSFSLTILILFQLGVPIPNPLEWISVVYDPVHSFFQ